MLRLAKAANILAEEDLLKLKVVIVVGGALLAVDIRPHAAPLAHVTLYDAVAAAIVVLQLRRLLYVVAPWLRLSLIHEFLYYWILYKFRSNIGRLLLVAVDKVANLAEAKFHRVHRERAGLVGEHVPHLAQLLVDGACKDLALLV